MRIVVADDESLARFNLIYLLRELLPDAEVYEASDGVELVDSVRLHRPHLVLADIAMPRLDGLAAIERLADHSQDTRFVVVTAHADFEYARRGIGLRIGNYLLKPVEKEELAAVLDTARIDIAQARQRWAAALSVDLAARLQGAANGRTHGTASGVEHGGEEHGGADYLAAVAWQDGPDSTSGAARSSLEHLDASIGSEEPQSLLDLGLASAALLTRLTAGREQIATRTLEERCHKLSSGGVLVSALWHRAATPGEALARVSPAFGHPEFRFAGRPGKAWPAPTWLAHSNDDRQKYLASFGRLLTIAAVGDEVRCRTTAISLSQHNAQMPSGLYVGELAGFASAVLGQMVVAADTGSLYQAIIECAGKLSKGTETHATSRIGRIQEHIALNYASPLSLSSVAKRYDMSPNYLSTLFHEKTGFTFLQYVTEMRISKAKRILTDDPSTPIKDVAALVGFTSARHFSHLFQKATGELPSDFARRSA